MHRIFKADMGSAGGLSLGWGGLLRDVVALAAPVMATQMIEREACTSGSRIFQSRLERLGLLSTTDAELHQALRHVVL